jgi:hypothetical protein
VSYVDWQFARGKMVTPTAFIPNGCGPKVGWLSSLLIPDELAGVEYSDCCDAHDLAYAQGGFWGLFGRKPRADIALGACLYKHFSDAALARVSRGGAVNYLKGAATTALGAALAPIYTIAVTLFGWTPFTWRWRFVRIKKYALTQVAERIGRDVAKP